MTQLTKENLIDLATQAKFNELGGILRYGVTEEALADFARLVVEAVRTTEIDPRFPAACYGNDLKSQTSESVSDSAAPEAAGMVTAEQFVQEIRKTCRDRTLYLMNRCGITNGDPVYRELLRLAFDVRKISAAPAQPQEQAAPQECQLTDAELSDPEYMRGYVAELQATISDLLAAPAPQPQEPRALILTGMEVQQLAAYVLANDDPDHQNEIEVGICREDGKLLVIDQEYLEEGYSLLPNAPLENSKLQLAAPVAAQQQDETQQEIQILGRTYTAAQLGLQDKPQAGQARELPPLTEEELRAGWQATFSTNNPFCPVDFGAFKKAARWAERSVKARAAQSAPAVPNERAMKRIANITAKYQSMQPEEGETWESWYCAAFDLISGEISEVLASAPAQTVPELPEAEIVKVLASLGIDTYPSKYGFPELQVSATSTPMIPEIVRAYLAAAAPVAQQQKGEQQ